MLVGPETLLPQELVYGFVRDAPAPVAGHQWTVGQLYMSLRLNVDVGGAGRVWLAPIDVVLDPDRGLVVQPDLVFVSSARLGIVSDRVWGAPDLVVEVLSPRPRLGSLDERLGWCAQYGVRECWLIHQIERTVEVIAFGDGAIASRQTFGEGEGIQSRVLPAFSRTPGSILAAT